MKKQILKTISMFLLTLIIACVSVIFPCMNQVIYASADEPELDTYLSGYGIDDGYIEQVDQDLSQKYLEYIYVLDNRIGMYITPIEEFYLEMSIDILDYNLDVATYIVDSDHYFDIAAIRMIRENIGLMNELAEEEVGYIDDDSFEFIFFNEDEYVQRWRAWNFRLSWNKFNVNFDADFAIMFSIVFLAARFVADIHSLYDTFLQIETDEDLLIYLLNEAYFYTPADIATNIYSIFNLQVLEELTEITVCAVDILTTSNIAYTVFQIVFDRVMPSVQDCMIVLYNSYVNIRGMELILCWIPTWFDKWGFTIRSIY